MDTILFYQQLLDLPPDWKIDHIEVDDALLSVHVFVEYTRTEALHPVTGQLSPIYDLRPMREWRHLDTLQYKTYIHTRLPRVVGADGKPVTIEIPWSDPSARQTWLFEDWAIEVLRSTKNQTQAARLLRLSFYQIHRIMGRAVTRGLERRQQALLTAQQQICAISIDEKCYKHRRFLTVISDPDTGTVLELADGKTADAAIQGFASLLSEHQREQVITATMDMSGAYYQAVKRSLPRAAIVYDKFHLFQYLTDAIDQTRRSEVAEQTALKHSRFLWMKNPEHHSAREQQRFEEIRELNLKTSLAWSLRETFRAIYTCDSPQQATRYFYRWRDEVLAAGNKAMTKVARMFERHLGGIINYFIRPASNARAERLNGKIQELKVIGKGYRTFEQLRIAVLFFFGNLDLSTHKTQ
jgi:transposase